MNNDEVETNVANIIPKDLEGETQFLVGQAYAIIKRLRNGETGKKVEAAMDRYMRDAERYHKKLYDEARRG